MKVVKLQMLQYNPTSHVDLDAENQKLSLWFCKF